MRSDVVISVHGANIRAKVAFVTGAGAGLGLAAARAFSAAGAAVVLMDVDEASVRAAAEALKSGGARAIAVRCDVSDDAQVEAAIEKTVATFGRLDAAYNNAVIQNILAEPPTQRAKISIA